MHQNQSLEKKIIGYAILVAIAVYFIFSYSNSETLITPSVATIIFLCGSLAIIAVTVSIFFLWDEKRVEWLENTFGPVGHVPHCGYCMCLWLAMFCTTLFHLQLVSELTSNRILSFLLSSWGLSFINVLFFELITVMWFKKVKYEFELKNLYKGQNKNN